MPTREFLLDGLQDGAWTAAVLVAGGLTAVCLGLLFHYERRLMPPRLGALLLALRLTAAGLIVLALLEPQWRVSYERERSGRIVVAADVSESMTTTDRSLSDAEALRLARALGIIGNAATDAQLDTWAAALDAGRPVPWVTPAEAANAEAAQALAETRQRSLAALRRELAALPRSEIVRRLLTHGRTPLLDRLGGIGTVERRVFAGSVRESTPDGFDDLLVTREQAPDPDRSNLALPLQSPATDAPLAAVIILTDGRDTVHADPAAVVAAARSVGAPVFPVVIGSEHRPRDLAITSIESPAAVFQNDRPVVRVNLRTTGFRGRPVEVQLLRDGDASETPVAVQTVTPTGDAADVRFELRAETLGRERYTARIPPHPEETRDDNNARRFAFQVVNDKARVLLIDGDARWEFRYLAAALQRDPRIHADSVLFQQPYMGLLPTTFFPRELRVAADAERTARFADYDAILVGDVSPQQLNDADWSALEQYVRSEGGTLVLIAGKRHMPAEYTTGALAGMLPIEELEEIASDAADAFRPPESRGFRLQLTPDGEAVGALLLDGDPELSRRLWSTLPGHTWGLRGRAKPGSTVWATAVRADGAPDLVAERASAVMVEQNLGSGRVVWIGIDSTWRWRSRTGDLYHHRFWGQLVRGAAEFKAAAHTSVVQFGPERPQIEAGEVALFRAEWADRYLQQHPDLKSHVELTPIAGADDAESVTAPLVARADRPRQFEARISGLPAGDYRAQLLVENADADAADVTAEFAVVATATPELVDLTANTALLKQIAAASGGELLRPDQLYDLPDRLKGERSAVAVRQSIPVWNHWGLLAVFCLLVGSEWLIRKLNGLP